MEPQNVNPPYGFGLDHGGVYTPMHSALGPDCIPQQALDSKHKNFPEFWIVCNYKKSRRHAFSWRCSAQLRVNGPTIYWSKVFPGIQFHGTHVVACDDGCMMVLPLLRLLWSAARSVLSLQSAQSHSWFYHPTRERERTSENVPQV